MTTEPGHKDRFGTRDMASISRVARDHGTDPLGNAWGEYLTGNYNDYQQDFTTFPSGTVVTSFHVAPVVKSSAAPAAVQFEPSDPGASAQ